MESGEPVNVTERSGMPPLSVRKGGEKNVFCCMLPAYEYNWKIQLAGRLPGAICILHPESCCILEICSPPLPITKESTRILNLCKTA